MRLPRAHTLLNQQTANIVHMGDTRAEKRQKIICLIVALHFDTNQLVPTSLDYCLKFCIIPGNGLVTAFPKYLKKGHSYEPQLASTNQHTPNFKNSTIVSNHRKSKSKSLQVSNCRLKMSDRRPGYNAVFNILFLLIGFRKSCQSRNFQFHLVEFSFRFSKTH